MKTKGKTKLEDLEVKKIKKAYGEYIVNYETYRKSCLMLAQRFDWSNIAQQSIKIYSDVLCFGNKVM